MKKAGYEGRFSPVGEAQLAGSGISAVQQPIVNEAGVDVAKRCDRTAGRHGPAVSVQANSKG